MPYGRYAIGAGVLIGTLVLVARPGLVHTVKVRLLGRSTVSARVAEFGRDARGRMAGHFAAAEVDYPPDRLLLAAFKSERELQVYAANTSGSWRRTLTYPILAASGALGPKLREGDRQVPEGIYEIESLNPNSRFHLSLRVSYPNAFDRQQGGRDGRQDLGGDIMIHGDQVSIGCLAMGDEVVEELFVLAADAGWRGVPVIISPVDFRQSEMPSDLAAPVPWVDELYEQIRPQVLSLPL